MTMSKNIRWRILRALSNLETTDGPLSARWLSHMLREEYEHMFIECQRAVHHGLVWFDRCGYRLTTEGAHVLSEIRTGDLTHAVEEHKWKVEALTGMTPSGKQTDIQGGAVPGVGGRHYEADQDEWIEVRRRLKSIGISPEDIQQGRVRQCVRCCQLYLEGSECCGKAKPGV